MLREHFVYAHSLIYAHRRLRVKRELTYVDKIPISSYKETLT
jgi:hypothetical protein